MSVERSNSQEEARKWLLNQWKDEEGTPSCPKCGCEGLDWYLRWDILEMSCEDCGEMADRYFKPEKRGGLFDETY